MLKIRIVRIVRTIRTVRLEHFRNKLTKNLTAQLFWRKVTYICLNFKVSRFHLYYIDQY